ncbi:hypothetical protein IC614_01555 [Allosphingosinicella flava]|uniref:Uncharacterized protein n=1 Tax=Allosphingosinicella flava TaxID=2771430 RepID=A0A7T2GK36_9SPHN|nr:hypothetical protein [Sphingosinicella flava]QPQ55325.1 hypothetical protein IC614_01555 [Sphingosinicella flava]
MPDEKKSAQEAPVKGEKKWVKTGVAVGIGSAAIVAALLYANRAKDGRKKS